MIYKLFLKNNNINNTSLEERYYIFYNNELNIELLKNILSRNSKFQIQESSFAKLSN